MNCHTRVTITVLSKQNIYKKKKIGTAVMYIEHGWSVKNERSVQHSHQIALASQNTFVRGWRPDAECGGHPSPLIFWTIFAYSSVGPHHKEERGNIPILLTIRNLGEESLEEMLLRDEPSLLICLRLWLFLLGDGGFRRDSVRVRNRLCFEGAYFCLC